MSDNMYKENQPLTIYHYRLCNGKEDIWYTDNNIYRLNNAGFHIYGCGCRIPFYKIDTYLPEVKELIKSQIEIEIELLQKSLALID